MRIGLVIYGCNNEYFSQFIDGVKKYCAVHNIDLLVLITGAPNWQADDFGYHDWYLTKFVNEMNLDGAIVLTGTICHYVSNEEIRNVFKSFKPLPLVSVNVKIPGVATVMSDSDKGFTNLVTHLVEKHKLKKFLFLTSETRSFEIRRRLQIFKSVLKKHSLSIPSRNILHGSYTFYSAENAIRNYMNEYGTDFEAVVCITDEMAYGIISGLEGKGISVPEDVIVTGFDDTAIAKSSYPTLTSVNQQVFKQGELSAEVLWKQILGEKVPSVTVVETSSIMRQSCGCIKKSDGVNNSVDCNGRYAKNASVLSFNGTLKYLSVQEQIQRVQYHVNRLQGNLTLDELTHNLREDFTSLGISKAAICLYKQPIKQTKHKLSPVPAKARVYFAFDDEARSFSYDPDLFFDCENVLLPEYFFDFLKGHNTVMSLYHGEYLYGYLVVKLGDLEPYIYTLFCSVIAKSICSAFEVSRRRAENLTLAKTNNDLSILSCTDELTGIFNRRGFMKVAQNELKAAIDAKKNGLVIFGDIDGLKKINDTYGHDAGDKAILAEVHLLKKAFREADTIGRLGGDEFAILSIALSFDMFENLKARLADLCKKWNESSKEEFTLSISLGAVAFSRNNADLSKLLKLADIEQYKEKEKHKANRK